MQKELSVWEDLAGRNVDYYNRNALSFFEGTRDHDVSQNRTALLDEIKKGPPCRILDFGCGPGRDLKALKSLGHEPIGLEGSRKFVNLAREFSGCEVWEQDFLKPQLPSAFFDGVFANASLFHVPSLCLGQVLGCLFQTLKPGGILFSSNPLGQNEEGWHAERYGVYHDLEGWRGYMRGAGFEELRFFYRPQNLPIEQRKWLASLWKKNEGSV